MFGFLKKETKKNVDAAVQKVVSPATVETSGIADHDAGASNTTEAQIQKSDDHHFNSFYETRTYLRQIKDSKHRIKLLEKRKTYRIEAKLDTKRIEREMEAEEAKIIDLRAETADEISKLTDARQEWIMTRRYVDCQSWEQIALDMDLAVRTVQKLHGKALPLMEIILIEDGKITVEAHDSFSEATAAKVRDYKEHFGSADASVHNDTDEEEAYEYFND